LTAKIITTNWKPRIDIDPSWEKVKLGDIFTLSSGKFLPKSQLIEGEYPLYGGNGINGYNNEYFVDKPTITFGRVGEYCGAVHITQPKSWISDNTLYVKSFLIELNEAYLATYLEIFDFNRFAKKGGQPSISQDTIYSQVIPLPPISIQNEIVERIESERALVDSAKQLIDIYQAKIKSVIAKVWADVDE
jgi:restriction endonuclease S subunit